MSWQGCALPSSPAASGCWFGTTPPPFAFGKGGCVSPRNQFVKQYQLLARPATTLANFSFNAHRRTTHCAACAATLVVRPQSPLRKRVASYAPICSPVTTVFALASRQSRRQGARPSWEGLWSRARRRPAAHFYGWFVVAGTFAVTFVGFGCAYSFSAFLVSLQHDFAASRGSVRWCSRSPAFFISRSASSAARWPTTGARRSPSPAWS